MAVTPEYKDIFADVKSSHGYAHVRTGSKGIEIIRELLENAVAKK